MSRSPERAPKPGQNVLLISLPPGLVDDLPEEDRRAIEAAVGRPVRLVGYDDSGRAELEFVDENGNFHFIWVAPTFIREVR